MLKLTNVQLGNEVVTVPVEILKEIDQAFHHVYDDNLFNVYQNTIHPDENGTMRNEICHQWLDQENFDDVSAMNLIFRIITAVAENRINLLDEIINAQ